MHEKGMDVEMMELEEEKVDTVEMEEEVEVDIEDTVVNQEHHTIQLLQSISDEH